MFFSFFSTLQFIHKSNLHTLMVATHKCIQFIICTMDLNTVHTTIKCKPRATLSSNNTMMNIKQRKGKHCGETKQQRTTNVTWIYYSRESLRLCIDSTTRYIHTERDRQTINRGNLEREKKTRPKIYSFLANSEKIYL